GRDVLDPRHDQPDADAARARFDDPAAARRLARQWCDRLALWAEAGVCGFRLLGLDHVPAPFAADLIASIRNKAAGCQFLGWTPGVAWSRIAELAGTGLDAVFASLPWWDGRASWYTEEHELLRRIGRIVAPVEAPFGSRLANRVAAEQHVLPAYRQA